MEPSWGHAGPSGAILGNLGASWCQHAVVLGAPWCHLWANLAGKGCAPQCFLLFPSALAPKAMETHRFLLYFRCAYWGLQRPSWSHLGTTLGHLGASCGHLGAILGPSWDHLEDIWGPSRAILGQSWGHLGASCGHLVAILGRSRGHLGPSWGILGPWGDIFGYLGAFSGKLGALLGPSWGHGGAFWDIPRPFCDHLEAILEGARAPC